MKKLYFMMIGIATLGCSAGAFACDEMNEGLTPRVLCNVGKGDTFPFQLTSGFSVAENTHRWTIGHQAKISVPVVQDLGQVSAIIFKGTAAFGDQNIKISLNNQQIGNILTYNSMTPTHTITVPFSANLKDTAEILFEISNPQSPGAYDPRILGLAFNEVTVQFSNFCENGISTEAELKNLLKTQGANLLAYLQKDQTATEKYSSLILSDAFSDWAKEASLNQATSSKIKLACQMSMEQVKAKKTTQKQKNTTNQKEQVQLKPMTPILIEEKPIEKLKQVDGFVNNYDQYEKYFDVSVKPNADDIAQIRQKYFNFEIDSSTGLQAQARTFVAEGYLLQLLKENPALIGSTAQMQAYFGHGKWTSVDRERAQGFDPSPILKFDYVNPHGPMGDQKFDVSIYSFFHTILEQADKNMPRDEEAYKYLLDEIQKGIRVRHLMQQ